MTDFIKHYALHYHRMARTCPVCGETTSNFYWHESVCNDCAQPKRVDNIYKKECAICNKTFYTFYNIQKLCGDQKCKEKNSEIVAYHYYHVTIPERKRIKRERARINSAKSNAKRKRNLKWIKLWENPFPEEVKIAWHHHTNFFIIPLPRKTHLSNLGKQHREKCAVWIKKLYSINIDSLIISCL